MRRLSREYHDNKVRRVLTDKSNPVLWINNDGIYTENPDFNKAFQKLVIDRLQSDTKAGLQELQDHFISAGMYYANILRHGRRGAFMDFLLGLPLNVPYKYGDLANFLVKLTGERLILDQDPHEVDFFYWAHVEYAIHTLLKEHRMKDMYSLDITD